RDDLERLGMAPWEYRHGIPLVVHWLYADAAAPALSDRGPLRCLRRLVPPRRRQRSLSACPGKPISPAGTAAERHSDPRPDCRLSDLWSDPHVLPDDARPAGAGDSIEFPADQQRREGGGGRRACG